MARGAGMLLADRFVQDPAPVAVPRRKVVVDGPGQDSRIRFDALAVDGLQDGDVGLLARLALSPGRHRIRNQAGPWHERNLLPVDAPSLQEIGGEAELFVGVLLWRVSAKLVAYLAGAKRQRSVIALLYRVRSSHWREAVRMAAYVDICTILFLPP